MIVRRVNFAIAGISRFIHRCSKLLMLLIVCHPCKRLALVQAMVRYPKREMRRRILGTFDDESLPGLTGLHG